MDLNGLGRFLVAANKAGHASGVDGVQLKEPDGSTSIRYSDGPLTYHDCYDGGEPYCGRIRVCHSGDPVWCMTYYGSVSPVIRFPDPIYNFLAEALLKMPEDAPFRGPKSHNKACSRLKYENHWDGTIHEFNGSECILDGGLVVFSTVYMGGVVNAHRFD